MEKVPQPQINPWPWVAGLSIATVIIVLLIFVIIPYFTTSPKDNGMDFDSKIEPPPGGCKCIFDTKIPSPSPANSPVDAQYRSIEYKDNKTFCGFEKNGYKWGCKPTDCEPACV